MSLRMPSYEPPKMPDLPDVPGLAPTKSTGKDKTSGSGGLALADQEDGGHKLLGDMGAGGAGAAPLKRHESRTGILLLVAIIIAASGILYTMRKMGMSVQLEESDVRIDYAIDEQAGLDMEVRDRLLKELEESGRIIQVALKDLKMNPFAWEGPQALEPGEDPEAAAARTQAEQARLALEKRERAIAAAADKLEVRSIMGGRTPIANISGRVVRVGDVIDDMFTVVEIKARTVLLQVDDRMLEIGEIDEESE